LDFRESPHQERDVFEWVFGLKDIDRISHFLYFLYPLNAIESGFFDQTPVSNAGILWGHDDFQMHLEIILILRRRVPIGGLTVKKTFESGWSID
jgi:hypothetical protein